MSFLHHPLPHPCCSTRKRTTRTTQQPKQQQPLPLLPSVVDVFARDPSRSCYSPPPEPLNSPLPPPETSSTVSVAAPHPQTTRSSTTPQLGWRWGRLLSVTTERACSFAQPMLLLLTAATTSSALLRQQQARRAQGGSFPIEWQIPK